MYPGGDDVRSKTEMGGNKIQVIAPDLPEDIKLYWTVECQNFNGIDKLTFQSYKVKSVFIYYIVCLFII